MTGRIRFCAALLFVAEAPVRSQTSAAGAVAGRVLDEPRRAVPGVAVRLADAPSNAAQATAANSEGRHAFSQVNPGNYHLSFTKDGFTSFQAHNQRGRHRPDGPSHKERVGVMLFFTFTNVLNHFQPSHPSFRLTSPTTFGQITGPSQHTAEYGIWITSSLLRNHAYAYF
jgi:hypothetical protein